MPGVKVRLVDNGMLQDLLMSRAPRKGMEHSNGHANTGFFGPARAAIANLLLRTDKGASMPELRKKLLVEAKAAGLSYGLIVRVLDDPMSGGDFGAVLRHGGGNVPPPIVFAKLTADGKEEALRGGSFGHVPLRAFEEIIAAGSELAVVSRTMGSTSSVVSPALLFKRIELVKPSGPQRKPPLLRHPYFATAAHQ